MSRPTQASINLSALTHNLLVARQYAPNSRIMAVIKADAYGHGLLATATALDADGFALLELDAAISLREAGFKQPIVLLEGFFSTKELDLFHQYQLTAVIHQSEQVAMLLASQYRHLSLFLKINTGMNRLGLKPEQFLYNIKKLQEHDYASNVTLMTHFACGVMIPARKKLFLSNYSVFNLVRNNILIPFHSQIRRHWYGILKAMAIGFVPGILLYGASPFPDQTADALNLKSVMT